MCFFFQWPGSSFFFRIPPIFFCSFVEIMVQNPYPPIFAPKKQFIFFSDIKKYAKSRFIPYPLWKSIKKSGQNLSFVRSFAALKAPPSLCSLIWWKSNVLTSQWLQIAFIKTWFYAFIWHFYKYKHDQMGERKDGGPLNCKRNSIQIAFMKTWFYAFIWHFHKSKDDQMGERKDGGCLNCKRNSINFAFKNTCFFSYA